MNINDPIKFEAYFSPYGDVNIDKINKIINCFKTSGYYDIIKTSPYKDPSNKITHYQMEAERAGLNNGADYFVCNAIFRLNLSFNVNNGNHPTSNGPINLLPELKEDYKKLQITNREIENYLNSKYLLIPHRDMTDFANEIKIYIRNLGDSSITDVLINLDAIRINYRSNGLINSIECVEIIKKLIECWMLLIVTIVPEVESDEEWLENTEKWLENTEKQNKKQNGGKLIKSRKKSNNKKKNKKYKKKTKTKRKRRL
jgi:hypothetical protein